jgi:hypothetical protein
MNAGKLRIVWTAKKCKFFMNHWSMACLALILTALAALRGEDTKPFACWSFDEPRGTGVVEQVSGRLTAKLGALEFVPGVRGNAAKFDGFTSRLVHAAGELPRFGSALTVEVWIAPQEYSWAWTGIVDHNREERAGFFLGLNHRGQVGFYAAVDGQWLGCDSKEAVPLLRWSQVVGSFDPATGFALYVNGEPVGRAEAKGNFNAAEGLDLLIGMSRRQQSPALTERKPSKSLLSNMIFDGLIDEVRLYSRALAANEIQAAYAANQPSNLQPLQYRRIPTGPEGVGRFGAYYTRLNYCPEWDRLWRVADHPDIVVRFDASPTKLIFWRGTGYIPYWAAENGVCVADQGAESANAWGCCEAMSDKQCRYSHVRIIENTPARAVVHWRTASPDIRYASANVDPDTGWGDWTDEYYYIYPDGVSVRYQLVHSKAAAKMEFQQTQTLNQPGTRPQDNLEPEAVTLLNMNGETGSYIWDRPYGRPIKTLTNANIQVINLKARHRHYVIGETDSRWKPFSFGAPPWTFFPCWNHWPVAQLPNDGCVAGAADRPSSSCVGTLFPVKHKLDASTLFARDLYGMTDQPVKTLVTLARSWNFPAELKIAGNAFGSLGYDLNQRAYVLHCKAAGALSTLAFTLVGSPQSPVLNPALVVQNWGDADPALTLDGKRIPRGKDFRIGQRPNLEGTDLIVWIKAESQTALSFRLEPQPQQ